MSQVWLCSRPGSIASLHLEDQPANNLAADQVRVAIEAVGVNFLDVAMVEGMPGLTPPQPFTPGVEAAGVVSAVGRAVSSIAVGQPVFLMPAIGAYAAYVDTTPDRLVPLPSSFDPLQAAATGICYGTSQYALGRRACLDAGTTLVVLGATGATGSAAVACAAAMGAQVIAVGGTPEKLQELPACGAQALINYRTENVDDRLMALTHGRKVDMIFDTVAGPLLAQTLPCLKSGGKIICVGATSGKPSVLDHMTIITHNIDVVGISFGAFQQSQPDDWRADMAKVFGRLHAGTLRRTPVQIYDFDQAPKALSDLRDGALMGKAVLRINRPHER